MNWLGRGVAILALSVLLSATAIAADSIGVNDESMLPLARGVELYFDPSGTADLDAVRRFETQGAFDRHLNATTALGYRQGATWAHIELHNATPRSVLRWLELGDPFTQSVVLFVIRADGTVHRLENGARIPLASRPVATYKLLFPIALGSFEKATLFLRIETRTATVIGPILWDPAAFANGSALGNAALFVTTGAGLMVIFFSILAWQLRRSPGLLGLAFAQVCVMLIAPAMEGLYAGIFTSEDGLLQARIAWTLVVLTLAGQAFFSRAFLQLRTRHPRLHQLQTIAGWYSLALVPVVFVGYNAPLIAVSTALNVSIFTAVVFVAGWGFGAAGRFLFAAWVLVWFAIAVRMIQQLGWMSEIPFIGVGPLLSFGIADIVLSVAIYLDIRNFRRAGEKAQGQLLHMQQTEQARLQAAVDVRTQELREAIHRAETANQAKTSFLSIVSHELRTPLHTILGYTQLLQRQLAGEARDKLGIIGNSSAQLLRLIDDILEYSRGETVPVDLQLDNVHLRSLLAGLEASTRILAGQHGNTFTFSVIGDVPVAVEADEQRLTQVLQNLVGNACKYTERGRIDLLVEPDCAPSTTPTGTWHRIRFTVADTGPGIAAAEQEHIFEPFTRASDRQRQPGAGLGLAIARQLTRAMGGSIAVESAPGYGSRFHVVLPLRELPAAAVQDAGPLFALSDRIDGRRVTLLVADDIVENRTILTEMFVRLGFSVVTASNGREALALCASADPPIDAALVDQFMPICDGWGFLEAIRNDQRLADLPVILISAAPAARPADFPADLDFDLKLMKPVRLDNLASLLQHRLGFRWVASATAESRPNAVVEGPQAQPGKEKMEEYRDLLALGKVLALQRWAQRGTLETPGLASFYDEIVALARAVDLAGLKRRLDVWEASIGTE